MAWLFCYNIQLCLECIVALYIIQNYFVYNMYGKEICPHKIMTRRLFLLDGTLIRRTGLRVNELDDTTVQAISKENIV